jgi:predicted aspartyl protease
VSEESLKAGPYDGDVLLDGTVGPFGNGTRRITFPICFSDGQNGHFYVEAVVDTGAPEAFYYSENTSILRLANHNTTPTATRMRPLGFGVIPNVQQWLPINLGNITATASPKKEYDLIGLALLERFTFTLNSQGASLS